MLLINPDADVVASKYVVFVELKIPVELSILKLFPLIFTPPKSVDDAIGILTHSTPVPVDDNNCPFVPDNELAIRLPFNVIESLSKFASNVPFSTVKLFVVDDTTLPNTNLSDISFHPIKQFPFIEAPLFNKIPKSDILFVLFG